jgi:hypothetical protein
MSPRHITYKYTSHNKMILGTLYNNIKKGLT